MPKKRSTQSGSNSATAKLISKINKFGQNVINNNNSAVEANEQDPRQASYYDDDDEVFVLTAKQKLQLQRNEYLESLTKEQLKIEAKRRGHKTAGTKTELVQFKERKICCFLLCDLFFCFTFDFNRNEIFFLLQFFFILRNSTT